MSGSQPGCSSGFTVRIDTLARIRDTQLHEDKHRYKGNGAGVLATLRTAPQR